MIFVDTNYFLRFLLHDVSSQHEQAKTLFSKGAKGEVELFTSTVVIFEIIWVMMTTYAKTKPEVIEILGGVLSLGFIKLEERGILEEALRLFNDSTLEFEDCYNLAYAGSRNMSDLATFDKKLLSKYSLGKNSTSL